MYSYFSSLGSILPKNVCDPKSYKSLAQLKNGVIAKLGYRYVVDPTDEEEAVANANLIVSVNVSYFHIM